jgi:HK97 gp10 family phage protein
MMPYKTRIPEIVALMNAETSRAVQRAGFMIEAEAKSRARFDTGYMRSQIRWTPYDRFSGEVIGGAHYTIHNEYGTTNMSAQPMFLPATEIVRPKFEADMIAAINRAIG